MTFHCTTKQIFNWHDPHQQQFDEGSTIAVQTGGAEKVHDVFVTNVF